MKQNIAALVERIRQEPVLVTALVTAIIAALVAFGVPVTSEQSGAILALVAGVLAFVVRRKTASKRYLES